jgi:hypothetical protein
VIKSQVANSLEDGAHGIDLSRRPMGEVGEGTVEDFAVKPKGLAEEDGGRGVAIRYCLVAVRSAEKR